MTMNPTTDSRIPPPGSDDDDEAMRQYGRDLALDGLLDALYVRAADDGGMPRAARGRPRRWAAVPGRLSWGRIAGVAAAILVGVAFFFLFASQARRRSVAPGAEKPPAWVQSSAGGTEKQEAAAAPPAPPRETVAVTPPDRTPREPVPDLAPETARIPRDPGPPVPETPPPPAIPAVVDSRPAPDQPAPAALLVKADGPVESSSAGSGAWVSAPEGISFRPGDRVRTTSGRARIALASGGTLYANRDTQVRFGAAGDAAVAGIALDAGEIVLVALPGGSPSVVETPQGRVTAAGGHVGIRIDAAGTTVAVARGKAEAASASGRVEVGPFQQAVLAASAPAAPREARDLDRRLAWAVEIGLERPTATTALASADPSPRRPQPRTGRFAGELRDPKTDAVVMRYQVVVPVKLPAHNELALVVNFHGLNGREGDGLDTIAGALGRLSLADRFVLLGGKSRGAGWTADDDEAVLRLIAWAKETYPVDPRRVIFAGYSNGAWMSARLAADHPELAAGAAAFAGGGFRFPKTAAAGEARTEFYIVHGDRDTVVSADQSRAGARDLKAKGYRYVYRELPGADHGSLFAQDDVLLDFASWLDYVRHKQIPPTAEERKLLAGFVDRVRADDAAAVAAQAPEVARIGGPLAAKALVSALGGWSPEIRAAAAQAAGSSYLGREVMLELARLTGDRSEKVRQAAIQSLAAAATWRFEEAQAALGRVALGRQASPQDRLAAAMGLAKAVKLSLPGNPEDRTALAALVQLLDDEDARLRETAFGVLAKAVEGGFGYRADAPPAERRAAVAKWNAWLAEKGGK
jgi:dienelactone hydrolase